MRIYWTVVGLCFGPSYRLALHALIIIHPTAVLKLCTRPCAIISFPTSQAEVLLFQCTISVSVTVMKVVVIYSCYIYGHLLFAFVICCPLCLTTLSQMNFYCVGFRCFQIIFVVVLGRPTYMSADLYFTTDSSSFFFLFFAA